MKFALNSVSVQLLAGALLLFCAASLTSQCAQQVHIRSAHSNMLSSAPSIQR